jgi:hypothetical protein
MNPLEAVRAEIARLRSAIENMKQQLAALEQSEKLLEPGYRQGPAARTLAGLANLAVEDVGLTDKIRELLRASFPGAAAPTAIRDLLVSTRQIDPTGRSNFMAEIHNILKRLVTQGDVIEVNLNGAKAYQAARGQSAVDLFASRLAQQSAGLREFTGRMPSPKNRLTGPPAVQNPLAGKKINE